MQAQKKEDRDVLLLWDAMGYNAGIHYDKHTGELQGFAEDFQFGLCVQAFANKVNVLWVASPEQNIRLNFPISHHHVNTLTRYAICMFAIIICMFVNVCCVVLRYTTTSWTWWSNCITCPR